MRPRNPRRSKRSEARRKSRSLTRRPRGGGAVVERVVAEFDRACSRFRADSELSAVNAAAGAPVQVGPVLLEAVGVALRAAG